MAKHVLFSIASFGANSTTAMSTLPLGMDSPNPSGSAWEGSVDLSLYGIYGNMTEALLPVAIICVVCLLCTAVWLLAVGVHLRSGGGHTTDPVQEQGHNVAKATMPSANTDNVPSESGHSRHTSCPVSPKPVCMGGVALCGSRS